MLLLEPVHADITFSPG